VRAVIQRVSRAEVFCESGKREAVGRGYLVLLGVECEDGPEDAEFLARKTPQLRLFPDAQGVMNLSLLQMNDAEAGEHAAAPEGTPGEILLVSQFTLHADTRKGRRPHYGRAARPEQAIPLYERLAELLRCQGVHVATGVFGDHMKIDMVADGPVTILLDSMDK